jgi:signal transduction histidine kinase
LSTSILIVSTSAVLSIFLMSNQTRLLKVELEKEGKYLARNLAINSEYGVLIGNRSLLLDLIGGQSRNQDVAYIIIQDRSGETLAQLDKEVISKLSSEKRNQIISLPAKTDTSTQKHLISDEIGTFWGFSTPILTTNIRREKEEIGIMMEESQQEVKKEMIGIVRVGISLSPMEEELAQIKMIIFLLTLLVVAFGVGFTIFLVNLIIKPIDNLVEATKTIAEGDLSLNVFSGSEDEIGELSRSFNQMVENLKKSREKIEEYNRDLEQMVEERTKKLESAQAQLLQSEKLSAVGQLISGVAHELNNPLTSVIGFSQLLLSKEKNHKTEEYLNKITREAERCAKIVNNLLTFSRTHKPEKSYVGINGIIERTLDLMAYQFRTDNIEVIKKLDPNLPKTMADFHQLQQVFLNIINNAYQAMKDKRETRILTVETERSGLIIRIKFSDTGPGIPKGNLSRIFDPFFTTKEVGKGTGLGLSISYGIVKEHGGDIYVLSELG